MNEKILTHELTAEVIHAALKFAATKDSRYYLHGVHIRKAADSEKCVVESTNGHMAIMINDKDSSFKGTDVIIRADICALLPKTGRIYIHSDGTVSANNYNSKTVKLYEVNFEKALIDYDKYPNISNAAIRSAEGIEPGIQHQAFNVDYINKAISIFPKLSHLSRTDKGIVLCYGSKSEFGTNAIFCNVDFTVIVVIMPARNDDKNFHIPAWVRTTNVEK